MEKTGMPLNRYTTIVGNIFYKLELIVPLFCSILEGKAENTKIDPDIFG